MFVETEFQDLNVGDVVLACNGVEYTITDTDEGLRYPVVGFYAEAKRSWGIFSWFDAYEYDYTIPRKVVE